MSKTGTTKRPAAFEKSAAGFAGLDEQSISELVASAADIALAIAPDGRVLDVHYTDPTLEDYAPKRWMGKHFTKVVTPESVEKIEQMLDEVSLNKVSRPRQVNHAAKGSRDLPVVYRMVKVAGIPFSIAYGTELRQASALQQQLVTAQMELEREYRKIREAETRYRIAFQKLAGGVLIVSARDLSVQDANAAAAQHFGLPVTRAAGSSLRNLVHRNDREALAIAFSSAAQTGVKQVLMVTPASGGTQIRLSIEPYREQGVVNCIVNVGTFAEAGEGSARDRLRLESMEELIPEAFVLMDAKGTILEVNDHFLDLAGALHATAVVGKNINVWLGSTPGEISSLLARSVEGRKLRQVPSILKDELGTSRQVRLSVAIWPGGASPNYAMLIAEQAQRESQLIVNGAGAASSSTDFSELVGRVPLKDLIREATDVIERLCVEAALRQTGNNRASAAELLGLSRQSLYMKLRRYGLEDFDGRD